MCLWVCGEIFYIFERESAAFQLLLSGAIETSSVSPELIYSLVNTFKTNSFYTYNNSTSRLCCGKVNFSFVQCGKRG